MKAPPILDFFRLSPDGHHYRRMVQGFQRIFAATIFFGSGDQPGNNTVVDWARFHFFDDMHLVAGAGRKPADHVAGFLGIVHLCAGPRVATTSAVVRLCLFRRLSSFVIAFQILVKLVADVAAKRSQE